MVSGREDQVFRYGIRPHEKYIAMHQYVNRPYTRKQVIFYNGKQGA